MRIFCDPISSLSFQEFALVMRVSFVNISPNTSLAPNHVSVIVVAMSWLHFQPPCTSGGFLARRITSVKCCATWAIKYIFLKRGIKNLPSYQWLVLSPFFVESHRISHGFLRHLPQTSFAEKNFSAWEFLYKVFDAAVFISGGVFIIYRIHMCPTCFIKSAECSYHR